MKLGAYAKDKLLYFGLFILMSVFTIFFLKVQGLGWYPVFFLIGGYFLVLIVSMLAEFYSKHKFYGEVMDNLEGLDKKFYISEMLKSPSFEEGKITYEALSQGNKAMNDEIGKYKLESKEYREYIEMWIHEVKTPVASLKLFLENNHAAYFDEAQDELVRVETYLEQVLYYARSTDSEKDYLIKEIFLDDCVKTVLKQNSRQFIKNKIKLNMGTLDYKVNADNKWVAFVLAQILGNAVKYRSDEPEISISAEETKECVVLHIKDNGIGIGADDLPRVFEKGFTGRNGRIYGKSTGIGLYLCKKLCDKMKIPLQIQSTPGTGTTITLSFMKNCYYDVV